MRLFISYARLNRRQVEDLQDVLRRAGHDAWFDEEITAGDDWWKTILTSIESCDIFVFALTPESTDSDACRAEFQYAVTLNKPILPIMLKEAELPVGRLAETHYVVAKNLRNTDTVLEISRALFRLQERIVTGEFAKPEPSPERPPFPFPPDPLSDIRNQLKDLRSLSEEDLLRMVYRIKQVSRSSKKISEESRNLLGKIASNPSLPYGIVQEAQTALNEMPKAGQGHIGRYGISALVLIILALIVGYFVNQYMTSQIEQSVNQGVVNATQTLFDNFTQTSIAQTEAATEELEPSDEPTEDSSLEETSAAQTEVAIQETSAAQTEVAIQETSAAQTELAIQETSAAQTMLAQANATATENAISTANAELLLRDSAATEIAMQATALAETAIAQANARVISVDNASQVVQLGAPLFGHNSTIRSLAFSPDGRLLASGSSDFSFRVWDSESRQLIHRDNQSHTNWVTTVVFSPDGSLLATAGYDGIVYLWDTSTWSEVAHVDKNTFIWELAFSPDGSKLALGDSAGNIEIWDINLQNILFTIKNAHADNARTLAYNPEGTLLVSGGQRGEVILWDTINYEIVRSYFVFSSQVNSVKFSHDGKTFAGGGADGSIRIWDVKTLLLLPINTFHSSGILNIAFSPDDSIIASASVDNSVRLWDLSSFEQVTELTGHTSDVWGLAFSPDGTVIVSGGRDTVGEPSDKTIRFWGLPED